MPRLPFLLLICVALTVFLPSLVRSQAFLPEGVAPMEFGRDTLVINTDRGRFEYDIEVAITPEQQARGMMWRPDLGPNKGMLFIFERERPVTFWMQNTLIPLDMIFIDNSGKLVSIQREAEPLTTTKRPSNGPARFTLEIDGGAAALMNINETTTFEFGTATLSYLAASNSPFKG